MILPGLLIAGDTQIGNRKASQADLWLGAFTDSAFITDLATGTRARSWERGNGRGMIVGLRFHQDMNWLLMVVVFTGGGVRVKTPRLTAANNRCVVGIGGQDVVARLRIGVFDHFEQ